MPDSQQCKCEAQMELRGHEKDYGDTVAKIWWCPQCGRLLVDDWGPVAGDPDKGHEDKWYEPASVLVPSVTSLAPIEHDLECLKKVGGDYRWTGPSSLDLKGNCVIPTSTINAFKSRMLRKISKLEITVTNWSRSDGHD